MKKKHDFYKSIIKVHWYILRVDQTKEYEILKKII